MTNTLSFSLYLFSRVFDFYPLQMVSSQIVPRSFRSQKNATQILPINFLAHWIRYLLTYFQEGLTFQIFLISAYDSDNWRTRIRFALTTPENVVCGNMSEAKKICACIGQPFSRRNLPIKSTIGSDRASRRAFYRGRHSRALLRSESSFTACRPSSGCSRRRRLSASLSGFQPDNRRCKRDLGDDNTIGGGWHSWMPYPPTARIYVHAHTLTFATFSIAASPCMQRHARRPARAETRRCSRAGPALARSRTDGRACKRGLRDNDTCPFPRRMRT